MRKIFAIAFFACNKPEEEVNKVSFSAVGMTGVNGTTWSTESSTYYGDSDTDTDADADVDTDTDTFTFDETANTEIYTGMYTYTPPPSQWWYPDLDLDGFGDEFAAGSYGPFGPP